MIHSYDVETAREVGIFPAVILYNIAFWIAQNAANDKNYYEGDYWTYNSVKAYEELFPEATGNQIRRALESLRDKGYLKTGSFNSVKYDRTLWYALTAKGKEVAKRVNSSNAFVMNNELICHTVQIDLATVPNRNGVNDEPIPDINTDINTDKKPDIILLSDVVEEYHAKCKSLAKVRAVTETRKKHIISAEKQLSSMGETFESLFQRVEASDFLTGRTKTDRPFKADFDWIIKQANLIKIMEGRYDNRNTGSEYDYSGVLHDEYI